MKNKRTLFRVVSPEQYLQVWLEETTPLSRVRSYQRLERQDETFFAPYWRADHWVGACEDAW